MYDEQTEEEIYECSNCGRWKDTLEIAKHSPCICDVCIEDIETLEVGDKIQYDGEYDNDNDLYEEFEENGFVHEVTEIDKDSNLLWVVGCEYAIPMGLVSRWVYD